ncbi:putative quinol monooxygenase [Gulosibacter chungangensis]|nr:putative quinol monooxygenase [Gulosibacter chungangensis]
MTVTTLATYECAPGDRNEVLEILEPARIATISEPGCEYFLILQPQESPDQIVLIEGWRSPEHLAAHRETAHFQEIILGQIANRVAKRSVSICDEVAMTFKQAAL